MKHSVLNRTKKRPIYLKNPYFCPIYRFKSHFSKNVEIYAAYFGFTLETYAMRLLKNEILNIQKVFARNLKDIPFSLYLFGSRVDDQKRGGDTYLLLLVSDIDFEKVYSQKSLLKFDLEDAVGDQKVDLTLTTSQKIKDDDFLTLISQEMIELT